MAANSEQQRWRLGQIFVAERARLLRAVRRKLFDVSTTDAEDLVSDVFYSVLRRGDFVAQVENLTAYVYRALANRIAEYRRTPHREQSLEQAGDRGDDPLRRLAENDAYSFFDPLGDLIMTGPTGTNVMDVHLVLVR